MVLGGYVFKLLFTTSFILTAQPATVHSRPEKGDAPVTDVRTLDSYEKSRPVSVIIEGEFPSTCYEAGKVTIRKRPEDIDQGVILFHVEALRFDRPCENIKSTYSKVVDLGILPARSYAFLQLKDLRERATFVVKDPSKEHILSAR